MTIHFSIDVIYVADICSYLLIFMLLTYVHICGTLMVIEPFILIFFVIFIYSNKGMYPCLRSELYYSVSYLFYYMLFYDMRSYIFEIFVFSERV